MFVLTVIGPLCIVDSRLDGTVMSVGRSSLPDALQNDTHVSGCKMYKWLSDNKFFWILLSVVVFICSCTL